MKKITLTTLLILCVFYSGIKAQITSGFELDGNATSVLPNPPDDWDLISNGTSSAQVTTGVVSDPNNIFMGGGSKDDLDINNWGWTTGTVPDKDDILHGGVALYNNCKIYFFADRFATNGSSNIGFWLFKSNVSLSAGGTFSGVHTVGDLFIVSEFVNGGGTSVINAYKWVGTGGDVNGTLQTVAVNGTNAFATTNSVTISSPWAYIPKTGPANQFAPGAFFEGGIDLCNIQGLDPCFTSFLLETRSSFSVDAVLKDFLNGGFTSSPQVTLAGGARCINGPAVTLSASVTGGIMPYTYSWNPGGNTTASIVVSPTVTTTYTFTVAGSNGCTKTAAATVTVSALPNVNAGADKTINCTTTSVTLNGSSSTSAAIFSWATVNGNIVSGGNTATPTVNAAGTYVLTVSNTAGCTTKDTAMVTFNGSAPDVHAGTDKTLTCTTTSVSLNGSSSTPNALFVWTTIGGNIVTGGSTASPTVNAGGTYILTVTNPFNGCSAKDTVMVNVNTTLPNVNAGVDKTLTCTTTSVTLNGSSSTAGALFSWATVNGNIVAGASIATPTVNAAGSYTLTVTNPVNGCTAQATVNVAVNATVPDVHAGADVTLTCATTSVALSGSSSTGGVNFNWTTNGHIVTGGTTATPTVDAAGSYTLTVTNPLNGCTANDVVDVMINTSVPNVNAGPDKTLTCAVTQTTLNGSSSTSGAVYLWVGKNGGEILAGATTATPIVQVAGRYILTITNPVNGCTAMDSADVFLDVNAPNANAGVDVTLTCATTSVTLSGSTSTALTTYLWSTLNGHIVSGGTTLTPTVDAAGIYMLTVTNTISGCQASDAVCVKLNVTPPNVNAGADVTLTCTTTSVSLSGSSTTPGATFVWATANGNIVSGGTAATPTVDAAGMYTLTATNPVNGCTAQATVNVILNNTVPDVNAGANVTLTCATTSVTLNGASTIQGALFSWTTVTGNIVGGGSTAMATVDATGAYTLTVTDPVNGCTAHDVVNVLINVTAPNVNAGADITLTCANTSIALNGSSTTPGAMFSWSTTVGNIVSGGTTASPMVDAAGTYTLTVTNPINGCTASGVVNVTIDNTVPDVNAGTDKTVTCVTTQVTMTGSSTTPGAIFAWTAINGGAIFSGATTATPIVKVPGIYILTVTNPVTGCTGMDSAQVFYDTSMPDVDAGGDMMLNCVVSSLSLDASSETAGATIQWTTAAGGNIVSGGTTFNPTVNAAGTYILTVTHPTSGCTASDTVKVTLNLTLPNVNAGIDTLIGCGIDTITLHSSSSIENVGYNWTTIGGHIVSDIHSSDLMVDAAGTYILTVIDRINGCSASDTVKVNLSVQPIVDLGNDTTATFCTGHITLNAGNPGMNFLWSTGATTQTIDVSASGTYYVTVMNNFHCMATDTINVFIHPGTFNVDLGNDTVIVTCVNDSFRLDAGVSNAFYAWSTGETTQKIFVHKTGTYYITVTDSKGCTASDAINVQIYGAINLDLGPDTTVCGCIILNAYVSGATSYHWCSGGNYAAKNVCKTGTYCVTVSNGVCMASDTIHVTVNQPPVVDLGNDITVVMTTLTLNAGNTGAMFMWNTGATTQTITVSTSGQYIVNVTDMNGCMGSDTINVSVINGVAEILNSDFDVNIYPNPSSGNNFNLAFDIAERGNVEIRIVNTLGIVVYSEKLENFKGEYYKKIALKDPAAGIYVADILEGNLRSTRKIIIE